MASRPAARALRQSIRQLAPAVQRRTFVSAVNNSARATVAAAPRAVFHQQSRGVKTIDFAGTKETVYGVFISLSKLVLAEF